MVSPYPWLDGSSTNSIQEKLHLIRQIADTIPNGMYVYDLLSRQVIYTNAAVLELFRTIGNPEVLKDHLALKALVHPDDALRLVHHYQQLLTQHQPQALEIEYRLHCGEEDWCWLHSRDTVLTRTSDGQPHMILGTIEDITLRKQREAELCHQAERERLISQIALRIRQSLDLSEILNTTVADVRQFLQADRVLIYQFEPNWQGIVVVESVGADWMSVLDTTIRDPCFGEQYIRDYQQGRIRSIDDIYADSLTPCHVEFLSQFQVCASLVLPILRGDQLWGLLIAHHCQKPRHWQDLEVKLLQDLATQVGIAIQQSELYYQVQTLNARLEGKVQKRTAQLVQSLEFAAALKRITDRLRDFLDEHHILETAVQELVQVLQVDYCGAAMYSADQTTATIAFEAARVPLPSATDHVLLVADAPAIHAHLLRGDCFEAYDRGQRVSLEAEATGDLACPDLFERLAAKLLCPIMLDAAIYAPEECESAMPVSLPYADLGTLGYLVIVHQTDRQFSQAEIHLVTQVANQCAIAIRQARLYQAARSQVEVLAKLNHLKDDFLSTVSHELRTPMTNMRMAIRMLSLTINPEADRTARYLQILTDQCEREISLINDLLDLQRLEAGGQSPIIMPIQLHAWVNNLVQPFQERFAQRQQQFQLQITPNLPILSTDPSGLERILVELLSNACKYSPAHAKILLSVLRQDNGVLFQVCNSGAKISQEELPRIFDKFYRIPSHDPWKEGGTGLGLALVRKLVHHLRGTMQVNSDDNSTCFQILLPIDEESTSPFPNLDDSQEITSGIGKRA